MLSCKCLHASRGGERVGALLGLFLGLCATRASGSGLRVGRLVCGMYMQGDWLVGFARVDWVWSAVDWVWSAVGMRGSRAVGPAHSLSSKASGKLHMHYR